MNTAFLPVADSSSTTNKMATRHKPQASSSTDDTSAFAGILASQAPAPAAQPSSAASSGQPAAQAPASARQPDHNASAGGASQGASGHPSRGEPHAAAHQTSASSAHAPADATPAPHHTDTSVAPAAGRHKALYAHLLARHGQAHPKAASGDNKPLLPAQLQKILAALPASGKHAKPDLTRQAASTRQSGATGRQAGNHPGIAIDPLHAGGKAHATDKVTHTTEPASSLADGRTALRTSPDIPRPGKRPVTDITDKTRQGTDKARQARASAKAGGPGNTRPGPSFAAALHHPDTGNPRGVAAMAGLSATAGPNHSETHATGHTSAHHSPVDGHLVTTFSDAAADPALKTVTLERPFGHPQWGAGLSQQFSSLVHQAGPGGHTAELRLDPPHLGPLRITINLNDTLVQAVFTSAHASVRTAVEQALPQLQQQLEQEGLSLGQASVGEHGHPSGHAGNNPEQSPSASLAGHATAGPSDSNNESTPTMPAGQATHRPAADALVDTFA